MKDLTGQTADISDSKIQFNESVYVLFDSRSSTIPDWLKDWYLLGDKITTSLSSQPYLKVYRKLFDAGQCVDLGGNYGPGSSNETRSNYAVVYGAGCPTDWIYEGRYEVKTIADLEAYPGYTGLYGGS